MHLGGGIKLDESDGLSRFKKKFSNNTKKIFYITKLICNSDLYLRTRSLFQLEDEKLFLIGDNLKEK